MLPFEEEITDDIKWRSEQLLIAKTLPFTHDFSESHKEFLIKYSIPIIYAVWEGFVQNVFQIYVRQLNKLSLTIDEYCINILAHTVDSAFPQLKEYPGDFNDRIKFIVKLNSFFQSDFQVSAIIKTQSNVELEMLNKILFRFNLDPIPHFPYKQQLKDLLKYRNRIAHGDNSLVISKDNFEDFKKRIDDFVILVESLMHEVFKNISTGYNDTRSYLNNIP